MKLFGRTAGYYLFWTGFVYFWVGVYLAFTHTGHTEYASLGFVLALSVPLLCPPVARHFNMEPVMFNWFGNKTANDFVEQARDTYQVPQVEPVALPQRDQTVYRIGKTEDGKVTLSLGGDGGTIITMNNAGVDQLIRMLEVAKEPEEFVEDEHEDGDQVA